MYGSHVSLGGFISKRLVFVCSYSTMSNFSLLLGRDTTDIYVFILSLASLWNLFVSFSGCFVEHLAFLSLCVCMCIPARTHTHIYMCQEIYSFLPNFLFLLPKFLVTLFFICCFATPSFPVPKRRAGRWSVWCRPQRSSVSQMNLTLMLVGLFVCL